MNPDTFTEEAIQQKSDEDVLTLSIHQPALFGVLLERYQEAFLRKARTVIRNKEDAEDIVQETFTKIYMHASSFKKQEGASFKSWAYKILLNTSFTHYKRHKRDWGRTVQVEPEFLEAFPDLGGVSFEHDSTLKDYIASVISRMPDRLGRALQLHFIEGKPQGEVAKIEGVSIGAIKTRIHRAKKEFKEISASVS